MGALDEVQITEGEGAVLGVNVGHPIVTMGTCGIVILCTILHAIQQAFQPTQRLSLVPQIRLWLPTLRVHKLYLLTYLLTY